MPPRSGPALLPTSQPRAADAAPLGLADNAALGALFDALSPVHSDPGRGVWLAHGDSLALLERLAAVAPGGLFDMVFADPPYFLSNDGITCQNGAMVKVNKGEWDRSRGIEQNHEFNLRWLSLCQRLLTPNGTIWVSGTHHVILSAGFAMQQLGMKLLNTITWEKPNPPPNLSCRYFTHSTETLLWAAKGAKSKHVFNYAAMRAEAGGRQMKSVWRLVAPYKIEKRHGRHPTQKPLALLERCITASTGPGALVLDPFLGSGTTALAALRLGRRCLGVDTDARFVALAAARLEAEPSLTQPVGVPGAPGKTPPRKASTKPAKLGKRGAAAVG